MPARNVDTEWRAMRDRYPSECTTYRDTATGAVVTQWTHGASTDHHLYFTSPSVTVDDRWLVFLSDRSGHPNLFAIDRSDGSISRLTRNEQGLMRSYVYPCGGGQGLSKASPCLDPHRSRLFYCRGDVLYVLCLSDDHPVEHEICRLPRGQVGAFMHVSPDGRTLCVPRTDERAFIDKTCNQWEQMRAVAPRIARKGLCSFIYLVDVETGEKHEIARPPFWVTHVQFDPSGTGRIIFNHEGFSDLTDARPFNRIWCLSPSGAIWPLSPEPSGEWRAHENWSPDGRSILYHGARNGFAFVAARTWKGELIHETGLRGIEFWHATGLPDGRRLVVDRPAGLISIVDPQGDGTRMTDLCRHDSSVEDQDAHPHPLVTPRGDTVVFTSSRGGSCNIYEVSIYGERNDEQE